MSTKSTNNKVSLDLILKKADHHKASVSLHNWESLESLSLCNELNSLFIEAEDKCYRIEGTYFSKQYSRLLKENIEISTDFLYGLRLSPEEIISMCIEHIDNQISFELKKLNL